MSTEPLDSVLACSTRDGRSLFIENRSSQVLRIRPDDRYDRIAMAFVDEERDRKSHFAAWSASERYVRGERLVRPVRRCAAGMRNTVDEGAYVEDALRQAFDTAACRRVIDEAALEDGTDPIALRSSARASILRRARAVLRDRLLPSRTTVVARG